MYGEPRIWTTKHNVRFETRSTDWHGGKKAEWERRITGKSGVTKINGVMWGSRIKGTARTFKNGNSVEHLKVFGWDGVRRVHGSVIHIDIKDGKVWIQYDGTSRPVATELVAAGIPKEHIVLGFHPPDVRRHTEFALG